MSVKPSRQPLTYEAYAVLPEDGRRWELIDGDFFEIEQRFDRASRLTTSSFPEVDIELARVFRA